MSEEPAPSAPPPPPPAPPPPAPPPISPAAVFAGLAGLVIAGFLLDLVLAPGGGRAAPRVEGSAEKSDVDRAREEAERRERAAARVLAPGARVQPIVTGLAFAEGPALAPDGSVYFTDIPADRILRWSEGGAVTTFTADSGGANGLAFDRDGHLLACEGGRGRVVAYDSGASATVLADSFDGKRFNRPNDLWVDPRGGIYFTDPVYDGALAQQGEHVYYLAPDGSPPARVTSDLTRPNGIVGTPGGKRLLVNDEGAGRTYAYRIAPGGALQDRKSFARVAGDGMKIDVEGKVYIAAHDGVRVYDRQGRGVALISVPEVPSNLCFAGKDRKTLVITARTSVYAVAVRVAGAPMPPPPPPPVAAQPAGQTSPTPTAAPLAVTGTSEEEEPDAPEPVSPSASPGR